MLLLSKLDVEIMDIRHLVIIIDTEISRIGILLMPFLFLTNFLVQNLGIIELRVYIFQKLVDMMKVEDIVAKVVLNCLKTFILII
jgi:hypothetical protein